MVFEYRWKQIGKFIHVRTFVGPDEDALAPVGTMRLTEEQWDGFTDVVELAQMAMHSDDGQATFHTVTCRGVSNLYYGS